jgi:hypothetical protein
MSRSHSVHPILETRQKSVYLGLKFEGKYYLKEGGLLVCPEPIILLEGRFGHLADLNHG